MPDIKTDDGDNDDFDAAFAEAANAVATDTKDTGETKTPEQLAADDATNKAAEEAAAKATADAAAAKAAEEAAAAKTPEQIAAEEAAVKATADAAAKASAEASAKATADAAAKAAAVQETIEQKSARESFEASIKPYEPSAEEKAALEQFEKDFPSEARAVKAQLKGVDHDINARVYAAVQSVLQHVSKHVDPVIEGFTASEADRHFTALKAAHPDYDAVIAKIPAWIDTQPAYVRSAMRTAYEAGTTQDVLSLVSDFKRATSTGAAPDAAAQAAASAAAADAAAKAKAKAAADAAGLAPVGSRRAVAGPKAGADPNDYDGAFEEIAAAFQK